MIFHVDIVYQPLKLDGFDIICYVVHNFHCETVETLNFSSFFEHR